MGNVESTRTRVFPKDKNGQANQAIKNMKLDKANFSQDDDAKKIELEKRVKKDTKVSIPRAVKDFGRIKKMVDQAHELDHTEKIAQLKRKIEAGEYQIDYDALTDQILAQDL